MPYHKLLMNTIAETEYTNQYIVQQLDKHNIHIDKSYLSKLVHGKLPAPREEISRAIAKICNVDERKLVIEGYFDKAPKEIKELLYNLKKLSIISSLSLATTLLDTAQITLLEEKINQEPIGDFLISILDYSAENILKTCKGNLSISSNKKDFKLELEEPISFSINNEDMLPIIPKNSKVVVDMLENYENGDIVALKYNNEIIARYYFITNGFISFKAIKKDSKPIDVNSSDFKILGKVKKVITEIQ